MNSGEIMAVIAMVGVAIERVINFFNNREKIRSDTALALKASEIEGNTKTLEERVKAQGETIKAQGETQQKCEEAHTVTRDTLKKCEAEHAASAEQRALIRNDVEELKKTVAVVIASAVTAQPNSSAIAQ